MASRCEKCGQTVVATDSECWHCGAALTPTNATNTVETAASSLTTAVSEETLPPLQLHSVLLYLGLTAVSLLLLIFTTRVIGQAPLLLGGGNNPLAGWQPVTDEQQLFTFNMPESWQTIDLTAASPEAETTKSNPALPLLSASFNTLVADSELWLLASADTVTAPVFVLVARSERLQMLSVEQFLLYAEEQFPPGLEINESTIINGELVGLKANLLFTLQQGEQQWRCQEQFIPTDEDAYLVTACAYADQFSDYADDFGILLRSFQPLDS